MSAQRGGCAQGGMDKGPATTLACSPSTHMLSLHMPAWRGWQAPGHPARHLCPCGLGDVLAKVSE